MAEVIAGCERIVAHERGKTSRCAERTKGLELRVLELTDIAKKLNMWTWLGPLLAGGIALFVGGVAGTLIGITLRLAPVR